MTDLSQSKNLVYKAKHKIRFVTAASLFDGHDASINIMRRILQASGAEVIHLGHNRSVDDVVTTALEEDVQGIAISSYQGGHIEFFKYMVDLLKARGGAVTCGAGLAHSSRARTIKRGPKSNALITEGPFAETVEQVSGFLIVTWDGMDMRNAPTCRWSRPAEDDASVGDGLHLVLR